jgi:adenine-specific DNA methylase
MFVRQKVHLGKYRKISQIHPRFFQLAKNIFERKAFIKLNCKLLLRSSRIEKRINLFRWISIFKTSFENGSSNKEIGNNYYYAVFFFRFPIYERAES